MFSQATLRELMSRQPEKALLFYPFLVASMREFAIDSLLRAAAFLATIAHESGELKYTSEIWGPTTAQLRYEGREDLGNTQPGDGKRFLGRGLIQITGRDNYKDVSSALGIDFVSNPELLSRADYATRASCWWWRKHGCNGYADIPDFGAVTRVVNGGMNGWEQRLDYYKRAQQLLQRDFSNVIAGVSSTAPEA